MSAHPPARQIAVPLASVGQRMQLLPQAVASSSAAQVVPQWWYPVPHVTSQLVPLQVAAVAPVGTGQAVHELPHEFTESLAAQMPEHGCVGPMHTPLQAFAFGMQAPRQTFWLA